MLATANTRPVAAKTMPYLSSVLHLSRRNIRHTAEHVTQSVALEATTTGKKI